MEQKKWFKAKTYGWGWQPATWQGWLITLGFIVLILLNSFRRDVGVLSDSEARRMILENFGIILILILIVWRTGEKPRWQWGTKKASYKNIQPRDLRTMMKNKDFTLLDVRINSGETIVGTDLGIPRNKLEARAPELPQDKKAKLVVYCNRGNSSQIGSEELIKLGYENVYNLEGGFQAWQEYEKF